MACATYLKIFSRNIKSLFCIFFLIPDILLDSSYHLFFETQTLPSIRNPTRTPGLVISQIIMSIVLLFHQSPAKNFKFFYTSYLQLYKSEFPNLPSYNSFIQLQQSCLCHFHALLIVFVPWQNIPVLVIYSQHIII